MMGLSVPKPIIRRGACVYNNLLERPPFIIIIIIKYLLSDSLSDCHDLRIESKALIPV